LENKIQILQNQVDSLQEKVIELETNLENQTIDSKYALSGLLKGPESSKTIEQGDYTLQVKKDPYSTANRIKVEQEIHPFEKMDSNILSNPKK